MDQRSRSLIASNALLSQVKIKYRQLSSKH
jgi:hypothetical protein